MASKRMHQLMLLRLGIFNAVLKQQNIPPFHFWKLLLECHIVPHQQHQFFDEGLCTDSVSREPACKKEHCQKNYDRRPKNSNL